jgi:hypothetical protein
VDQPGSGKIEQNEQRQVEKNDLKHEISLLWWTGDVKTPPFSPEWRIRRIVWG